VQGNGRSPWARRWKDLIEAHVADLGGVSALSEAQRSLIKRASTIEVELEQVEGKLSEGKAQDLATYATATAHLRRVFEALGLARKARNMGDIIDGKAVPVEWSPFARPLVCRGRAHQAGGDLACRSARRGDHPTVSMNPHAHRQRQEKQPVAPVGGCLGAVFLVFSRFRRFQEKGPLFPSGHLLTSDRAPKPSTDVYRNHFASPDLGRENFPKNWARVALVGRGHSGPAEAVGVFE
jgi:hypothetical protein